MGGSQRYQLWVSLWTWTEGESVVVASGVSPIRFRWHLHCPGFSFRSLVDVLCSLKRPPEAEVACVCRRTRWGRGCAKMAGRRGTDSWRFDDGFVKVVVLWRMRWSIALWFLGNKKRDECSIWGLKYCFKWGFVPEQSALGKNPTGQKQKQYQGNGIPSLIVNLESNEWCTVRWHLLRV